MLAEVDDALLPQVTSEPCAKFNSAGRSLAGKLALNRKGVILARTITAAEK
jgi:hypothetical protein